MSDNSLNSSTNQWATPFLNDRSVLITGGTSGIGKAIAAGFAQAGAQVLATGLTDKEVSSATQWAEEQKLTNQLSFKVLDVGDNNAIKRVIDEQQQLHVLICCAGLIRRGAELESAVFEQVVDINLNGSMRCAYAAKPALVRSKGCIINTASMLSFFGGGLVPGYSASKGGIVQLTKSLAIAWAKDGIRVNAIAPGWIRTPLTADLQEDEARAKTILGRTPVGRWGEPNDLVGPALFLATPMSGFITGAVIPVDGGYSIS